MKHLQNRRSGAIERTERRIAFLKKVLSSSQKELTEDGVVLSEDDIKKKIKINEETLKNTKANDK